MIRLYRNSDSSTHSFLAPFFRQNGLVLSLQTYIHTFHALSASGGKEKVMAKQFLVWKDRNCNGVNPEWLSLTGEEFYEFIRKEENKGRRFINMVPLDKGEDGYIIEANEEMYKKHRDEKRHAQYIKEFKSMYETVSVYTYADEDNASLYDKTSTDDISIEEGIEHAMLLGKLNEALAMLDKDELGIIKLYFFTEGTTERFAANMLGISQPAFHKKMKKIIEKLKKLVIKSGKSVQ